MKKIICLITLGVCMLNAQAQQQALPVAQLPRVRCIDIKHIALDIRFDWSKKQVIGQSTITCSMLKSADRITLDAGMMSIQSVMLSNQTKLTFQYDSSDKNDALVINLNRTYSANEEFTFSIQYHTNKVDLPDPNFPGGSNVKGVRFLTPTSTEPTRRAQIWSMGEPASNRYWFPSYDAPDDFRTTELKARVENKFMVISNGQLLSIQKNNDGTHTYHFKSNIPYANHLTSFVVGEYADIRQQYKNIILHNYCYNEEQEATKASVELLPDMMKYFSRVTGVEYPFRQYAQVFVQDSPWGVANMGTSTHSENMVDDDRTHRDFYYLWDGLEGESLAQQWFGNYVTCNDWSEVWLNKAFARYFSELYDEYKNGREEFLLYQHTLFDHTTYLNDWNAGIRHPIVTNHYEDAQQFSADNYCYFHGAEVLHMLRKQLGDEVWWKAIQLYLKTNAGKAVSSKDLLKAVNQASGKDLSWFFDQWVYRMGHPVFKVTKKYDDVNKQLMLSFRQTQHPDSLSAYPQTRFFQGTMVVEVDHKMHTIWLDAKEENNISIASASKPQLVHVDMESSWVKEIIFEKSIDELIYQALHDQDILGRRWALSELLAYAKKENTSSNDKEKIYNTYRAIIQSKVYWRLKVQALTQLQGLLIPANSDQVLELDSATHALLLNTIKYEKAWVRSAAITFLGATRNPKETEIYIKSLNDESDRVINSAAIALGKSKSPKAFEALKKLVHKPSWKNQSLISALYGLKELNDPRAFEIAFKALQDLHSPHWVLGTPVWDYRIIAAQTIASLGKGDSAYGYMFKAFHQSMNEHDIHGIFYNTLLLTELADKRGQEVYDALKIKYKEDANAMTAVNQFESQWQKAIKLKK